MSLKFNQRCVVQKNINALSPPMFTKGFFQGISLSPSAFLSHLCVWVGVKGIRPFLVTMVIRALLAWLDCQEGGQKKKWGKVLMAYDGGKKGRVVDLVKW